MKPALALLLVASLASGAEPGEATVPKPKAYQLDAPFQVVQDGQVLLELPRGVVMPQESFDKVDQEFVRLQKVDLEHRNEPGPLIWFTAGAVGGAIVGAVLLTGIYLVTR